ncbi:MAG: hypothetical protein AB7V08_08740 [Elusimicrobiales bacterium]
MTAAEWNKRYGAGIPVRYFPVKDDLENFVDGFTRSEAWDCCGVPVVKITGRAGGVSISHITVLPRLRTALN